MKYQEEVNSKINESINEIQSQLILLMQTLVVQEEDKSFVPSPLILIRLGCLSEHTHPLSHSCLSFFLDIRIHKFKSLSMLNSRVDALLI